MTEMTTVQTEILHKWEIVWIALAIGLIMVKIAWNQGLFAYFKSTLLPVIQGKVVLKGFALFISFELILAPLLIGFILYFLGMSISQNQSNEFVRGWMNFSAVCAGCFAILLSNLQLPPLVRTQLWNQTNTPWYRHVAIGICAWFVVYPLIIAFNQLISIAVWFFFKQPSAEQEVVQSLRGLSVYSLLYFLMAFGVSILVPITEEYLFRGLLQSWLKNKLHKASYAIVLSSLIFAAFHFSTTQGFANIEILFSLFLFSCAIGYLYERQRSLWAPVGLHGFLNFVSYMMIFNEK